MSIVSKPYKPDPQFCCEFHVFGRGKCTCEKGGAVRVEPLGVSKLMSFSDAYAFGEWLRHLAVKTCDH